MIRIAEHLALVCVLTLGAIFRFNEFAATCPRVGFTIVEPHATSETRAVNWGTKTIFIHRVPLTKTSDIASIKVVTDGATLDGPDDALIQLTFTPPADRRLHEATSNHSGMHIAFMFGDTVMTNVVWQGPYGMDLGGVQVSLNHGRQIAKLVPQAIQGCTAEH